MMAIAPPVETTSFEEGSSCWNFAAQHAMIPADSPEVPADSPELFGKWNRWKHGFSTTLIWNHMEPENEIPVKDC